MTDFRQMFAGYDLDAKFKTSAKNTNQRVCSLGRIVTICQYMNYGEIRTRMKTTIAAIDGLLSVFSHPLLCSLMLTV
jgi:L-lactate permease